MQQKGNTPMESHNTTASDENERIKQSTKQAIKQANQQVIEQVSKLARLTAPLQQTTTPLAYWSRGRKGGREDDPKIGSKSTQNWLCIS